MNLLKKEVSWRRDCIAGVNNFDIFVLLKWAKRRDSFAKRRHQCGRWVARNRLWKFRAEIPSSRKTSRTVIGGGEKVFSDFEAD